MQNLEDIVIPEDEHVNPIRKFYNWSAKHINYKIGSIAGLIGGGIVYYINHEHGFWPATGGFGKQFFYNVFIAGFNVKTCEKLAKGIKSKPLSLIASTIIPTAQAFAITYAIHKLGGTPEAFDSTLWQVYVNLPIFFGFGLHYKKQSDSNITNP
jgi:hypothetical protein